MLRQTHFFYPPKELKKNNKKYAPKVTKKKHKTAFNDR